MVIKKIVIGLVFFGSMTVCSMQHNQTEESEFQLPASMLGPRGDFITTYDPNKYLLDNLQYVFDNITTDSQYFNFRKNLHTQFSVKDLEYLVDRSVSGEYVCPETACHRYTKKIPDLKYSSITRVLAQEGLLEHKGYQRVLEEDQKNSDGAQAPKTLFMNPFMKNSTDIERYYAILLDQRTREIFYNNIYPEQNAKEKGMIGLQSLHDDKQYEIINDAHDLTSSSIPKVFTVCHYARDFMHEGSLVDDLMLNSPEKRTDRKILDLNRTLFNQDRQNNNDKRRAVDNLIKYFNMKKVAPLSPGLKTLSIDCSQEDSPARILRSSFSPKKSPQKNQSPKK